MLVLTRKLSERLLIGDDICITVVRLEGGQVRLGIDAPRHVPVVRAELNPRPDDVPAAETPLAPRRERPTEPASFSRRTTPAPGTGIRRRAPFR